MPRPRPKQEPFLDYAAAQRVIEAHGDAMDVAEQSLAELERMRAAGGVDMLADLLRRDVHSEFERMREELRNAYLLCNQAAASMAHAIERARAAERRSLLRRARSGWKRRPAHVRRWQRRR